MAAARAKADRRASRGSIESTARSRTLRKGKGRKEDASQVVSGYTSDFVLFVVPSEKNGKTSFIYSTSRAALLADAICGHQTYFGS